MYSDRDSRKKDPVQDSLFPIYGIKTAKKNEEGLCLDQ